MLTSIAFALVVLTEPTPKITGVSMFKNGYSLITREFPISGSGVYKITDLPNAAYGTYWIFAGDGVTLRSVRTTTDWVSDQVPLGSLDQLLQANIGKTLTILVTGQGKVTGKLLSAGGEVVLIQTASGTVVVRKTQVERIEGQGALIYKQKISRAVRLLMMDVVAPHAGVIRTVSLENGLSWVPAYSVDITDPDELTLTARGTVVNDLRDFGPLEAKFVTGFPNLRFAGWPEPLFQSNLIGQFGGGGMGGGMTGAGFATQNSAKDLAEVAPAPSENTAGPGFQAEDLFFYRQSGVTMKRGDRAYYVLFSMKSPYEHIYTWDLPDLVQNNAEYRPQPEQETLKDVWHSLKFKNIAQMPLTTGAATTYQNGEMLGQDAISYTTAGVETTLRITKALDVQADYSEEEIKRQRNAFEIGNSNVYYDLITLKGSLVVKNLKDKAVHMKIRKAFTGELVSSEGEPKTTKLPKGLRDINPAAKLEWNPVVPAGETLTLTFTYQLYVRPM